MKDFANKTAVITGAGSGIGKATALEAAKRGMNVVLADINEKDVNTVAEEINQSGGSCSIQICDVSDTDAVAALAKHAEEKYGNVHFLFNNAGVSSPPRLMWECTLEDWEWVMGVNLNSVIYGVKYFVPSMLAHGEEAHIVNTASIAGLISSSFMNTYSVTKHAVVALSETLALDLKAIDANIGASVLCPAWIKTQIHKSERNRPDNLKSDEPLKLSPIEQKAAGFVMNAVQTGIEVEDVVQAIFTSIEEKNFYILTHKPFDKLIKQRFEHIIERTHPESSI